MRTFLDFLFAWNTNIAHGTYNISIEERVAFMKENIVYQKNEMINLKDRVFKTLHIFIIKMALIIGTNV